MAVSLFCNWFLSDWQVTTSPLGLWTILMADSVLFTYCPPGPEDLNVEISKSAGEMFASVFLGFSKTATVAVEV